MGGAGAFAREVIPFLEHEIERNKQSIDEIIFVVEDQFLSLGPPPITSFSSKTIGLSELKKIDSKNEYFSLAIADNKTRVRLARIFLELGLIPYPIVAKHSLIYEDSSISPGAILCSNSTVSSRAIVGSFFQLGFGSYLAHDCVVGDFVTIGPNSTICGNVHIEDEVQIGAGVVVKPGSAYKPIRIGKGSIIGAGAIVTKSVEVGAIMIGNPARRKYRQ